jgi:hypothetical protein
LGGSIAQRASLGTAEAEARAMSVWIVDGHSNRDIDQLLPWAYRSQISRPWPKNSAYCSDVGRVN